MIVVARRHGYSLIELVTVLVILGILIALAVPRQRGALEAARRLATQSNLRAVLVAQHVYFSEHRRFTTDYAKLLEIEPSLKLHSASDPIGSVRISVNPENPREICLFAESEPGDWLAVFHSPVTGSMYGSARPQSCSAYVARDFRPGEFRDGDQPGGTNGRLAEGGAVR